MEPAFAPTVPCVLVADADPDTRALYREAFAVAGCDVVDASDGRDALTVALVQQPALVITEIRLPLLDAVALCEILRRDQATAEVPILVVTAETRSKELERVRRAGADVVLLKPTLPDTILAEAKQLLTRSMALRARSTAVRTKALVQLEKSAALLTRSARQRPLSKTFARFTTTSPPITPPEFVCPICDRPLMYQQTHIGGVNAKQAERWDYYACSRGCGTFQYRPRTRKLRRL